LRPARLDHSHPPPAIGINYVLDDHADERGRFPFLVAGQTFATTVRLFRFVPIVLQKAVEGRRRA
jgi:hypothetical protein